MTERASPRTYFCENELDLSEHKLELEKYQMAYCSTSEIPTACFETLVLKIKF